MDYKPSDLFVSIVDFFAVLLPGAILSFAIREWALLNLFNGTILPSLKSNIEEIAVLLFSSYVLGHFIFMVGSYLDGIYDLIRRAIIKPEQDIIYLTATKIKAAYLNRLAARVKLDKPAPTGWEDKTGLLRRAATVIVGMLFRFFKPNTNPERQGQEELNDRFNTLKWSKSLLQLHYPSALQEINRLEADSKFFRSMVILLVFFSGYLIWLGNLGGAATAGIFLYLAFRRFAEQRWKSTQQAYHAIMVLEEWRKPEGQPKEAGEQGP